MSPSFSRLSNGLERFALLLVRNKSIWLLVAAKVATPTLTSHSTRHPEPAPALTHRLFPVLEREVRDRLCCSQGLPMAPLLPIGEHPSQRPARNKNARHWAGVSCKPERTTLLAMLPLFAPRPSWRYRPALWLWAAGSVRKSPADRFPPSRAALLPVRTQR